MNLVLSLLLKADCFGIPINLNYMNKKLYKTYFGGFFSILFITAIILVFLNSVLLFNI